MAWQDVCVCVCVCMVCVIERGICHPMHAPGVLVYHDMQYASSGGGTHGPIATPTQVGLEFRIEGLA